MSVVDADGNPVGPLGAAPDANILYQTVLVTINGQFVSIKLNGQMTSLAEASGPLYFVTPDCSGPPAAAAVRPGYADWYGYATVWPATGPERKTYVVTTNDVTWSGISTLYNSTYQAPGYFTSGGCTPGAPGSGSSAPGYPPMKTTAYAVVEAPSAPLIADVPGPLSIKAP